jgi:hypothetical protein
MLNLTSGGIMSRLGGGGFGARGLLRRADGYLTKEIRLVRTSEIALSSFTFGLIQGRFKKQGGLTIGLPVDLLAGATFHALSLFGFAKPYAHHLSALGDGALASFFTTTGYRVGERVAEGRSFLKSFSEGMFGDVGAAQEPAGGSTIADKELDSLVRAGT